MDVSSEIAFAKSTHWPGVAQARVRAVVEHDGGASAGWLCISAGYARVPHRHRRVSFETSKRSRAVASCEKKKMSSCVALERGRARGREGTGTTHHGLPARLLRSGSHSLRYSTCYSSVTHTPSHLRLTCDGGEQCAWQAHCGTVARKGRRQPVRWQEVAAQPVAESPCHRR